MLTDALVQNALDFAFWNEVHDGNPDRDNHAHKER